MNRFTKISAAAAGILASGMLLAPAALADSTCTITGNGSGSTNRCTVTINNGGGCSTTCSAHPKASKQVNKAKIKNKVIIRSNTGGNDANRNTGGDVSISSGNSNVDVSISNDVNN